MATVEELVVRIKADAAQLEREMKKAQNIVQQTTGGMGGALGKLGGQFRDLIPALSIATVVAFGKSAFTAADRLNDLALQTGFAASSLSALEGKLIQSGGSVDAFAQSIGLMNNNLADAQNNDNLVRDFNELGLSIATLQRMKPDEAFYEIARALSQIDNQFRQTAIGRDIFGRGFAQIQPMIKEAGGDLKEYVNQVISAGDALSPETLQRIDQFGDSLALAAKKGKNGFIELLDYILKTVYEIDDFVAKYAPHESQFVNAKIGTVPGAGPQLPLGVTKSTTRPDVLSMDQAAAIWGKAFPETKAAPNVLKSQTDAQAKAKKSLDDYIASLEQENTLLGTNEDQREGLKALYEAEKIARDGNIKLSEEERRKIEELANANYKLSEAMEESKRFAKELHDQLSKGLADAILDFDSASDAAANFARQIASTIIQRKITSPLADALIGSIDTGGISKILGFADGGSPPVGVPSIVGERGPEIFVPSVSGTIIPNHKLGGGMTVVQHNTFQSGVTRSEVASMLPAVASAAKDAVFAEIQRGGSAAKMVGIR